MRKILLSVFLLSSLAVSGQSTAGSFDGVWNTTVTCDAKGGTLGYTLHFISKVNGNVLHGERGTKGQPAYLAIDGKIATDGSAKLTASGNTAGSQYTHGPIKTEGEEYSYAVKSQFTATEGKGERSTGLGIVGRPCHYVFEKQAPDDSAPKQ
jgi:hypothetical protein